MANEGKISLEAWMKITAGLVVLAAGTGWAMVKETSAEGNKNAMAIAITQKDVETLKEAQRQNSQLFIELRGMIRSNEDATRESTSRVTEATTKILSQLNQVLEDVYWLKAGKYTKEQYEEFQQKRQVTAEGRPSSGTTAAAP